MSYIILNRETLKKSQNSAVIEFLVNTNFYIKKHDYDDDYDQLHKDFIRSITSTLQGQAQYHLKKKDFINKIISLCNGDFKQSKGLANAYSQLVPGIIIFILTYQNDNEEEALTKNSLIAADLYEQDNNIYYECVVSNFALGIDSRASTFESPYKYQLPGKIKARFIYDKHKKEFLLENIQVSNALLYRKCMNYNYVSTPEEILEAETEEKQLNWYTHYQNSEKLDTSIAYNMEFFKETFGQLNRKTMYYVEINFSDNAGQKQLMTILKNLKTEIQDFLNILEIKLHSSSMIENEETKSDFDNLQKEFQDLLNIVETKILLEEVKTHKPSCFYYFYLAPEDLYIENSPLVYYRSAQALTSYQDALAAWHYQDFPQKTSYASIVELSHDFKDNHFFQKKPLSSNFTHGQILERSLHTSNDKQISELPEFFYSHVYLPQPGYSDRSAAETHLNLRTNIIYNPYCPKMRISKALSEIERQIHKIEDSFIYKNFKNDEIIKNKRNLLIDLRKILLQERENIEKGEISIADIVSSVEKGEQKLFFVSLSNNTISEETQKLENKKIQKIIDQKRIFPFFKSSTRKLFEELEHRPEFKYRSSQKQIG